MANDLYTPEQAALSSLAALRYLSVLPRTVRQDFSEEFVAGKGMTVNVKGPITVGDARVYSAAQRAARTAIVFDDLDQTYYPVTISDQVYKAVRLPDDFATFTLKDLQNEVLKPQAQSVVKGVTAPLLDVMQGISSVAVSKVPAVKADGTNVRKVLIALRRELNRREVPVEGRWVAVGPGIEAALLNDELLQKANESGTDAMLRKSVIGELFGFTIVADPTMADYYGVAYNSDAFAHVTRPSKAPEGAGKSATIAQDGFALRWIEHYNAAQLEDQSIVDTFVGARILDPGRAVAFGAELNTTNILVEPATAAIGVGDTVTLSVTDEDGVTIPNRLVTWSAGNARCTVDADGVVTGVTANATAVTITGTYLTKTDTCAVTVS